MQPDTVETRVGRLEQQVARMNQQLEDQAADLRALAPLAVAFGRVELIIERLQDDERETRRLVEALHRRMDQDDKERRARQEERDKENQGRKLALTVALIAAAASLLSAVITAGVVLVH